MKKRANKRNSEKKEFLDKKALYTKNSFFLIPIRYLTVLGILLSLSIIYLITTPLTVYPVSFLLKIFVKVILVSNSGNPNYILILGDKTLIEIVPACIAGSAYLLLLILNLTVPMEKKKRIYSIILSVLILLALNILRITLLSLLYHYNMPFVDFTHKFFWYGLSTVFVVGLWFLVVKIFKIKEIPVYSDIRFMYSQIKNNKIKKNYREVTCIF